MNKLANLDFYNKEIQNIQQQLIDKLDNLVVGLGSLSDTELMQIAKQIDFFAEMEALGFTKLMNRVGKTFDDEIVITQSKGPFLNFDARWSLESIHANQTRVKFETKFTLPFVLKMVATQSLIDKVGKKFINAFAKQLSK